MSKQIMQPGTKGSDTGVCGHHLPREKDGGGGERCACVLINAGIKTSRAKLNGTVNARTHARRGAVCINVRGERRAHAQRPIGWENSPPSLSSPAAPDSKCSLHLCLTAQRERERERERQSEGGTARHAEERHVQVSVTSTDTNARKRAF